MQKLTIAVAIIFALLVGIGCEKNEIKYGEFEVVSDQDALLKINFVSNYATNPTINISLDGARISNPITARAPFPGGGYNTGGGSTADYLALAPGSHSLKIAVPFKGTGNDSLKLYETNITIEGGKAQTLHITDTATNTTHVILADDRTRPDSGKITYKFVNLMPNVASVDLYYGATLVAPAVAYKEGKSFTMVVPATSVAWTVREAGSGPAGTTIATYTSGSTITNQRSYTVFALGYRGSADANRKPYVSFLLNL